MNRLIGRLSKIGICPVINSSEKKVAAYRVCLDYGSVYGFKS